MTTTQVRYWELQENKRHNIASEQLTASQLQEGKRHNLATEEQGWFGLRLEGEKIKETHRHNVVYERETQRHNQATEALTATQIAESIRHNKMSESLTASQIAEQRRHNVAQENETQRHNIAAEKIDRNKVKNEFIRTFATVDRYKVQNAVDIAMTKSQAILNGVKTASEAVKVWQTVADTVQDLLGINFGRDVISKLVGGLARGISLSP